MEALLGLSDTAPYPWEGDPQFEVRVVDSPEELEFELNRKRQAGFGARMTAGYCWPWSDPKDGALVPDVKIDGWERPWNVKGDRRVGDAPEAALWATEDGGFGQVGCVYTAQGFEYDWNGVIIGPDLLWRDGRFVTDRPSNRDPDFRNRITTPDVRFDKLIRNIYKVLLTRGMTGTLIYSTDEDTRAAIRDLVHDRLGLNQPAEST